MKWDARIDYDETVKNLQDIILKSREVASRNAEACRKIEAGVPVEEVMRDLDPDAVKRLGWAQVYLAQIGAASRAAEAFDAWRHWGETGERDAHTRVRKSAPKCKTCGHIKQADTSTKSGHVSLADGSGKRTQCKKLGCSCIEYIPDYENAKKRLIVIPETCLDSDRNLLMGGLAARTLNGYKIWARRNVANTHSARYATINRMTVAGVPTAVISKTTGQTEAQVAEYQNEIEAERLLRERVALMKA